MANKVFPTINSVTLSGEVVSAPITRRSRGGPKQTTFIIGVTSDSAGPARIAVAAPDDLASGLSETLKVGVEVLIEGQLIAAPVRTGRGLTPLRISATRIHALKPDGIAQEIRAATVEALDIGEEVVPQAGVAATEKPRRKTARSKPVSARKSRSASAISISPAPVAPVTSETTETAPETKVSTIASQHGRQRRRLKVRPEDSQSLESSMHIVQAARPAHTSVSAKPASKRPAKSGAKKTGARSRKTTTSRPSKAPAKQTTTPESKAPERTKPPVTSKPVRPVRPARPARPSRPKSPVAKSHSRAAKPAKPRSKAPSKGVPKAGEAAKPTPASDSPFALTQSESSFDPFLVDDKD